MAETFFIFGAGYSGLAAAAELRRLFPACRICGTTRSAANLPLLRAAGLEPLLFDGVNFATAAEAEFAAAALPQARCCFSFIGPARGVAADSPLNNCAPGLEFAEAALAGGAARLRSLIYVSTIGVYGDSGGAWLDETAAPQPSPPLKAARLRAEAGWAALAEKCGAKSLILRAGGIYGGSVCPPGFTPPPAGAAGAIEARRLSRNPFGRLLAGEAVALIKEGQVFNRIHIADLAKAACFLARSGKSGIYNLCDDCPAPPQDFLNFAAALAGLPPPPAIPIAQARLSPAMRAFYRDNRRVSNTKLWQSGYQLLYPDYKAGLRQIYQNREK